jgi:putrescine transport system substrate-binding protein
MKITEIRKSIVAIAVAAALSGSIATAEDKVVNVFNWSDYIEEEVLKSFEADTGIKVKYDVFDSNEILETKLLTGGTGYDVVVPTASFLKRQIKAGVFSKLDHTKLKNISNVWNTVTERTAFYDPNNAYSINYLWGTTGIGLVKEKIEAVLPDAELNSMALLFDPENAEKLSECGIHVLDAPTEIIPAALKYLGMDPNSTEKADLEKAQDLLLSIRPFVRKFHSSEYISALANGDICFAIGWSGDILQSRDRADEADNGITVEYHIPKEGALMWFDQMAIPNDAPHPEAAHAFIDYMLDAQQMAKITNYVNYANGNEASQEFIDKAVLEDTAIYPDEATLANLFTHTADGPKYTRLLNRIWTKVKSGQ